MNETNNTMIDYIFNNQTEIEKLVCDEPQDINSFNDFFECFAFFARENIGKTIFGFCLIIGIIIANIYVIFMVSRSRILNVFDKIMIGHCLV